MQIYFQSMKKNVFLILITFVLLILTFGFWYGLPLYGLSEYFFETDIPRFISFISICLGVGFCFSLFFIPFHLSFAKEYATSKQKNMLKVLFITKSILIMLVAMLFAIFYLIVSSTAI
ncbi:hypothetical protein [Aquibacillus rhizosphaerae]|uniref:Uncharacterized protein n=1 Tax=Aquibacillus rhizosphaerae TaxID=3051431 RepID=A0ABT7LD08_9BACI|nr:hypothetical protein [Aquibacillus sp. LR5S19]MDL4842436.1 hypothetical protein [Aquibacillus sp. LR5S19]